MRGSHNVPKTSLDRMRFAGDGRLLLCLFRVGVVRVELDIAFNTIFFPAVVARFLTDFDIGIPANLSAATPKAVFATNFPTLGSRGRSNPLNKPPIPYPLCITDPL